MEMIKEPGIGEEVKVGSDIDSAVDQLGQDKAVEDAGNILNTEENSWGLVDKVKLYESHNSLIKGIEKSVSDMLKDFGNNKEDEKSMNALLEKVGDVLINVQVCAKQADDPHSGLPGYMLDKMLKGLGAEFAANLNEKINAFEAVSGVDTPNAKVAGAISNDLKEIKSLLRINENN